MSQKVVSDQFQHCVLTGIFIQNTIKVQTFSRNLLKSKWTHPNDKYEQVQWSKRVNGFLSQYLSLHWERELGYMRLKDYPRERDIGYMRLKDYPREKDIGYIETGPPGQASNWNTFDRSGGGGDVPIYFCGYDLGRIQCYWEMNTQPAIV